MGRWLDGEKNIRWVAEWMGSGGWMNECKMGDWVDKTGWFDG